MLKVQEMVSARRPWLVPIRSRVRFENVFDRSLSTLFYNHMLCYICWSIWNVCANFVSFCVTHTLPRFRTLYVSSTSNFRSDSFVRSFGCLPFFLNVFIYLQTTFNCMSQNITFYERFEWTTEDEFERENSRISEEESVRKRRENRNRHYFKHSSLNR